MVLLNSRLLAALILGFSSGLPFALTASTLQAWFTQSQVDFATIGLLSLLGIPYTLKFLWSPYLDFYQVPKLGLRKGWILLMQVGLVIGLFVMAQLHPGTDAGVMCVLALGVAFLSATQDIAIDAYRTDVLHDNERGLGAAYSVFTYRIAVLLSGGMSLVFADHFGWQLTYEVMAAMMFAVMVLTFLTPTLHHSMTSERNVFATMRAAMGDLWRRENIIILFMFVLLYKFGDALALSLMTNFLLHGLGFSLTEVGLAYKIVSFVAAVAGVFVGGVILIKRSVYFGLFVFGLAQAFSNLMFVLLAYVGKHFGLMVTAIAVENFCSGLSTAAFLAFLMALCNKKYTASQYALLSAIASLGRVFLGPVAVWMVAKLGWTVFYLWSFALCFPSLLLLWLLKEKVMSHVYAEQRV